MNKKKLFLTIILSGVAFGVNYFINFFLTAFVTENIGTEAYGYITLAKTIASYAVISTTALNSYATRYISLFYHRGDIKQANIYYNSVFWGDTGIGTIFLLICIFSHTLLGRILHVPGDLVDDVGTLLVLVFINLLVNLMGTALQAASIIKDKLIVVSLCKAFSYITEAVSLIILYSFLPAKIYYAGIGIIIATMIIFLSNGIITKNCTPELKLTIKNFGFSAALELVVNGFWNSLNSLGNVLNSGLDLLVANELLGGFIMGQVSIVKTITNIFSSLYQMVAQAFQPNFLKLYAKVSLNSKEELVNSLKFSVKISGLVSNLAFAVIVAFGKSYYQLWVPNQDCDILYNLTVIAVVTSIFEGAIYPLYYVYTLTIKNRVPCIITIIGGGLNVLSMNLLISNTGIGVYAVFLTTAVIMISINGIFNPIYMSRCLKLPWFSFYPVLLRHIVSCGIVTFIFKLIASMIHPLSWISLVVSVAVCCVIGGGVHFAVMFGPEACISIFGER